MKRKTIAQLEGEVNTLTDKLKAEQVQIGIVRASLEAAEKQRKDLRAGNDELKRLLHDAELRAARLEGYIDRVGENDDNVEELVEVIHGNRTVKLPRGRLVQFAREGQPHHHEYNSAFDEKRKHHWTSL